MAFRFKLEQEDGTPADPPELHTGRSELAARRHDPARPSGNALGSRPWWFRSHGGGRVRTTGSATVARL